MANSKPKTSAPSPLSSAEALVVGRASAAVTQLTILDDHWTRTAIAVTNGDPGNDVDALGDVVAAIDALLDSSRADFAQLAEIFRAHSGEMRATYEIFVAGKGTGANALSDAGRSGFRTLVEQHGKGDVAAMAADAAARLASTERVSAEKRAITEEFRKLKANKPSDGDFSEDQWVDIVLAAVGISGVLGPEAGAVVAGIAGLLELLGF